MKHLLCVLALCGAGSFSAPLWSAEGGDQKEEAAKAKPMSGMISAVDAEKKTVTLKVGKKDAQEDKVITVAEGTKIMVDGKEATLADLKAEMKAKVVMDGDKVVSITVVPKKEKKEAAH
jgi:hypothetical protein